MNGQLGPFPTSFPSRQPNAIYPLAGSCACCERDETVNLGTALKKCSGCKLTRCVSDCRPSAACYRVLIGILVLLLLDIVGECTISLFIALYMALKRHSVECQKKDWPRHKVTCSKIYSVNFENWE